MNDHHACCAHRRDGSSLAASSDFASASALPHYPPDLRIAPTHLDIGVRVQVEQRALDVSVTARVRAQVAGASELQLNGIGFLDLTVTGARHRYDGERIALVFEPALEKDEERVVVLRYRVESPKSGVLFSAPAPHRPDAPRYAVTDHESERARHWLAKFVAHADEDNGGRELALGVQSFVEAFLDDVGIGLVSAAVHGDEPLRLSFRPSMGQLRCEPLAACTQRLTQIT